jgi:SOS response associated peptidase (SRAP)
VSRIVRAAAQTVDTAPSYRQAFKKLAALIPADGFYEWKRVVGDKIPYHIGMKDNSPFVFAGLWEGWKDSANDECLRTCTIITGEPNEFVRGDPYPYAGRSARRASRSLVMSRKRGLGPVSGRPNESMAD